MNIVVPIKLVPDLVEELEINDEGTDLDRDFLTYRINEYDDHALEEALQLKESAGATVTVIGIESDDTDKVLFSALAKGADRAIKITGLVEGPSSHLVARAMAKVIEGVECDLILTGVQAADDLDGQVPVLLANYLSIPHLSAVSEVGVSGSLVTARKEYSGGVIAEFEAEPKVVLGIQAARETPRYAPVSRVRQIMKEAELDEVEVDGDELAPANGPQVKRMYTPEKGGGAEMLSGSAEEIAEKLAGIINQKRS